MRVYLRNVALGIPLALGAMLTLAATALVLRGGDDLVAGVLIGLIGIPLLFATLAEVFKQP